MYVIYAYQELWCNVGMDRMGVSPSRATQIQYLSGAAGETLELIREEPKLRGTPALNVGGLGVKPGR